MYILKKWLIMINYTYIFSQFRDYFNADLYKIVVVTHYNAANSCNKMQLQGRKKNGSTVIMAAETLTTKQEMIHLYYVVIVQSIVQMHNHI